MFRYFTPIALLLSLAACATQPATRAGYRDLTDAEKTALQRSLPSNFGRSAAAQFRWTSVRTNADRTSHVGYCAEIDARNPDGTRSGYRRFFALLIPDASGALTSGTIQAVAANSTAGDPAATQRVNASCRHWGYAG